MSLHTFTIKPATRPGFANSFLAVSLVGPDKGNGFDGLVVGYSCIVGIHSETGNPYSIPEALADNANEAEKTAQECERAGQTDEAARLHEESRLLRVAHWWSMCESEEGIKAMLADMQERGILWHFDDSADSIEWQDYYPLPREIIALEALRVHAYDYCDNNGLDIFALYPDFLELPMNAEVEKELITDPATLEQLKTLAKKWSDHMTDEGFPHPGAASFAHAGFDIVNPWLSICGRFEVDPVKEYGAVKVRDWQYMAAQIAGIALPGQTDETDLTIHDVRGGLDPVLSNPKTLTIQEYRARVHENLGKAGQPIELTQAEAQLVDAGHGYGVGPGDCAFQIIDNRNGTGEL